MTVKRFGPTNDAGVVIIESDAEKTIEASIYGSAAYTGILERGEPGTLITTVSRRDMIAKTGGFIPDSLLPDAGDDFWTAGEGAGVLFLVRVTDGNEGDATLTLFNRRATSVGGDVRQGVVRVDSKNGGTWGGRRTEIVCDVDNVTDIGVTTVALPIALHPILKDQLKGGTVEFTGADTAGVYTITDNDASDGVGTTDVNVTLDVDMDTDFGAGSDTETIIKVPQTDEWGRERKLAVVVKNGETLPSTEWGLDVYLNDTLAINWPNLSSDPNSSNYFVNVINNTDANQYIEVTDLWTGGITADIRPANYYGVIPTTGVAAKTLNVVGIVADLSSANLSTIGTYVYGADVVPDTYTLTRGAATWTVESVKQEHHTFGAATDATPYAAENPLSVGFTIAGTPAELDVITLHVVVLRPDECIGGLVYPDEANAPNSFYRITDNDETSVTITTGDLTDDGADDDEFRLEYKQELEGGLSGNEAIAVQDFLDVFDVLTSPYNDTEDQGYGLIKFGCPGITALAAQLTWTTPNEYDVQREGVAYAESKNHQFRYEIPESITTETSAKDYVNRENAYAAAGIGRSDHAKVIFPSWVTVADPVLSGRTKSVPDMGMLHGWEAKMARTWEGYHKAAAGVDVTLPKVLDLPTGDTKLNGEILNGAGLQRIIRKKGRYVVWGSRIPYVDSAWRFSVHREQLSYYEHVLQQNFDWVLFAINDSQEWPGLIASLTGYFYPEWKKKRALQGNSFKEAAKIKIDDENNTAATTAAGDLNADVELWMADMVERFIITVNKYGVFETIAA